MDAKDVEKTVRSAIATALAKRSSTPQSWNELKRQGFVLGGEPRIENGNIILPLEAEESLSKSAKSYMKYGTGSRFFNLPDGSAIKVSYITRLNPVYVESKEKLQQMRLDE